MLDVLIDRVRNYKDPKTFAINQGTYYIEEFNDGYTMTHPRSCIYFRNDGTVSRLSTKCNEFEWNLHVAVHALAGNTVEIPITHKPVIIDHSVFHYTEIKRPGNSLGINFFDCCVESELDTDYFLQYVDDVSKIMEQIMKVCKDNRYYDLPRELLAPYKRNKGPIGHYWVDFKEWNFPIDKFLEKKYRTLYLTLLSMTEKLDINKIMYRAEEQWNEFSTIRS